MKNDLAYKSCIIGVDEINITFLCPCCKSLFEYVFKRQPSRVEIVYCQRCKVGWRRMRIDGSFELL